MSIETFAQTTDESAESTRQPVELSPGQLLTARCAILRSDTAGLAAIARDYFEGLTRVANNTTYTAAQEANPTALAEGASKSPELPKTQLASRVGYLASRMAIQEARSAEDPASFKDRYERLLDEIGEWPSELVDKHFMHDLGFAADGIAKPAND